MQSDVHESMSRPENPIRSRSGGRTSRSCSAARRRRRIRTRSSGRTPIAELVDGATARKTGEELERRADPDRRRPGGSWRSAASARRTSGPLGRRVDGSRSTSGRTRCRERDFEIFKLLDFGDFVGVEGHLFRTKTNELTIWASALEFLAKCFLPLPEKWHGLQRRRDPLPPALPRPDRQPGLAAGLRGAQPGAGGDPRRS